MSLNNDHWKNDVIEVIAAYAAVDTGQVTEVRKFEDFELDSLDMMEIVIETEDMLGVGIGDFANAQATIGQFLDHVERTAETA